MHRILLFAAAWVAAAECSCGDELRSPALYEGMCDASAVVTVGDAHILAACDEDNTLRLYRRGDGGPPLREYPLDDYLAVTKDHREADIEAAARIGDLVYWIGSHGNNKDGKPRPNRHRIFATRLDGTGERLDVKGLGKPYRELASDLADEPRLADLDWDAMRGLAPEDRGALNIEGMAATPKGTLWIGLRNPVPSGRAILLELINPRELITGQGRATVGGIARVDLGGHAVRSMEYWPAERCYLLVSGPFDDDGTFQFWRWSGEPEEPPVRMKVPPLANHTPEAIAFFVDRPSDILVLSDDGATDVDGEACKEAPRKKRHFRAGWLALPAAP